MGDTAINVTPGTGASVDTRTESTNGNHRQVVVLGDPATNAGVAPVDATKGLAVDLSATGANSNKLLVTPDLPSGASTAANQATANTSLSSIDTKTPALGQALAAASVPVILPSATITTLTPPAAIVGFALDSSLTTIDTDIKSNITLHAGTNAIGNIGSSTATGSTIPANGFYQGGQAKTSLPAAGTDGNLVGATYDKFGRQVVLIDGIRDIAGTQTTTITASTSETTIGTAVASTFLDLTSVLISNTSATAARIDFRDTTAGSVIFSIYVPAGDTRGFVVHTPIPQTTVNTNWTAQSSVSVTDLRIFIKFIRNK